MNSRRTNDNCPLDELGLDLRPIVERIVRKEPPRELTQRVLERVKRQETLTLGSGGRTCAPGRRAIIRWRFASAAALGVTACTLLLLCASLFVGRRPDDVAVPPTQAAAAPDLPTAWAYHRAIAQSPEAVDSLLARHAQHILCAEPRMLQAHAFPSSFQSTP
jgi:hypothetical protein